MKSMEYEECSKAIRRLTPRIDKSVNKIQEMIKEIPIISEIQKRFYVSIIEYRYENVLLPLYQKIIKEMEDT